MELFKGNYIFLKESLANRARLDMVRRIDLEVTKFIKKYDLEPNIESFKESGHELTLEYEDSISLITKGFKQKIVFYLTKQGEVVDILKLTLISRVYEEI